MWYDGYSIGDPTATVFCFKTIAIRGKSEREQENSGCIEQKIYQKISTSKCFSQPKTKSNSAILQ